MERIEQAASLMTAFAARTGIDRERPPQRYLWTDAFALCNFLGLYRATGRTDYLDLARDLIDQVHDVLGRYGEDEPRSGWLAGGDDADHRRHPTRGGLRIGKKLPERQASERFDDRLEWERDGQYFHYLTRWMHALEQFAESRDDPRHHDWAVELYLAAHRGFVYRGGPGNAMPRMYWKMSVDLTRPQVSSMGQHDPLDGWITGICLQCSRFSDARQRESLLKPIAEFREMCMSSNWATADPLGVGGLLTDAWKLSRLVSDSDQATPEHVARLLRDADVGLQWQLEQDQLKGPAQRRLAFRELGLAIGLHAVENIRALASHHDADEDANGARGIMSRPLGRALDFVSIAETIERFWLKPDHQQTASWLDHLDINAVMLATSLAPDGYLGTGLCERQREGVVSS